MNRRNFLRYGFALAATGLWIPKSPGADIQRFRRMLGGRVDYITTGLTNWWKMNEPVGATTAADSVGTAIGNVTGNPVFGNAGKIGGCLTLDGTGDYLNMGTTALDFTGVTPRSFCIWLKAAALSTTSYLFGKYIENTGVGSYAFYILTTGALKVYFLKTNYTTGRINKISAATTITTESWIHAACTWSGATASSGIKLYANGAECGYQASDDGGTFTGLLTNANPTLIGAVCTTNVSTFGQYFNGLLDDARIYNRELSAAEVLRIATLKG